MASKYVLSSLSSRDKVGYDYLIKLLIIGDSGSGKSCILLRYSDNSFTPSFITTIGIDFKIKTIEVKGFRVKLQIWDTAGQERFRTITTAYYRGAMGILVVYDISNEKTFDNVQNWIRNIKEHASDKTEMILVGNKIDLESIRKVETSRGQELAKKYQMDFFETSAKTGINIDKCFTSIVEIILNNFNTVSNDNNNTVSVTMDNKNTDNKCNC
jgi:Ras-related protein Rab-8A